MALLTHLAFVAFTILGGFVAWLLPWVLIPHVATALWGARMAAWRPACPLSRLENWAREGAGRAQLSDQGFIAHYFEGRLYPVTWRRRVEIGVSTLIIGSWIGLSLR
ncbi:DUF2784 domain-containing protein [soil metagenome]